MKVKQLKVAAYARVSSREQAENQNALKQQISRLKESFTHSYPNKVGVRVATVQKTPLREQIECTN